MTPPVGAARAGVLAEPELFDGPDADVYLHDDWGDGKLQNRDGNDTTTYNGVEGVYRPEWTLDATGNAPTVNASNELLLDADNDEGSGLYTGINLDLSETITWYWTNVDKTSGVAGNQGSLQAWSETTTRSAASGSPLQSGYFVLVNKNNSDAILYRSDSNITQLISANASYPTDIKLTRDANGNWELFVGGSSAGTATDTTYTSPSYIAFGLSAGNFDSTQMTVAEVKVN